MIDGYASATDITRGEQKVGIPDATVSVATVNDLAGLRQFIADTAGAAGMPPDRIERLVLAVNELATNAVTHGRPPATVRVTVTGEAVRVAVHDHGTGFGHATLGGGAGPAAAPPPDVLRGRGLWLASHMVDGIAVRTDETGTTVTVSAGRAAPRGRTGR